MTFSAPATKPVFAGVSPTATTFKVDSCEPVRKHIENALKGGQVFYELPIETHGALLPPDEYKKYQ